MRIQSVAKNLVYQRKLKGYSQEQLSQKTQVTVRTIQRIEKGDVNPHLQTIKLLANALDIEVDELLILENPKEETIQKKWLLLIHGSPILGFIFPLNILIPLFLWIHKREDNKLYDSHGIQVINFQISMSILYVIAFITLLTIEGWGFMFFTVVIPFTFIVILYNIFKAINAQKCYYPLSFPFLKKNRQNTSTKIVLLFLTSNIFAITGCSLQKEKSKYDMLLEYEGRYEYLGESTLDIVVSKLDTTLYAVLDKAKYPLKYINKDSFIDIQNSAVVFQRDKNDHVISYEVSGEILNLLSRDFERMEMLPRKELLGNAGNYSYKQPSKIKDGLETGYLKNEFKNPGKIIEMVKETIKGNYPDVHSILIYKNDKLILEEYFYGYTQNIPHQLRSATKPFIGTLMGIAVDKGIINEKDNLLPYFEKKYLKIDNLEERKEALTIEDFLMFRHGMDCENNNSESQGNEGKMMKSKDWVKYTLDLPMMQEAGRSSSYCTGCPLTLGSLLEIATNKEIEDFAKENLFSPMGITNYNWRFSPDPSSMTTYCQMSITPRDLVKLAKMYKDGGKWQGEQILSKNWVEKTFTMEKGDYGYLWLHKYFIIDGKQYDSYLATGNGGQKINIWPKLDMITVFTGGNYNSYVVYGKSTPPNEMIPKYILEAIK